MGKGKRLRTRNVKPEEEKVYCLTKNALEQMLTRELRKRVEEDGWVQMAKAREMIADDLLLSINAGITMAYIALMESHTLGWGRIERDITPLVQTIDKEWTEFYIKNDHDVELAFDMLAERQEVAIAHTTANRKKGSA